MGIVYNPLLPVGLDQRGTGGGASVAGSNTEIQYNDNGSLGASADLTWDDTGKVLGVGGDVDLDDGGAYITTLQTITATANRTISLPDATGTVGLVAGSSGQLIYNSAGANAGVSGSVVGATGDVALSLAGAADTPPLKLSGTWFSGGTATTTKPQVLIEPSGTTSTAWSTSGTGLGVNAASGFAGNLLDLQVDGKSEFVVTTNAGIGIGGAPNTSYNLYNPSDTFLTIRRGTTEDAQLTGNDFTIRSGSVFAWSSTTQASAAADIALARNQAGVVAITDGSTGTGYLKQTPVAVSALPNAATVGAGTRGFVSDSTVAASGNFGATVTGGGSNNVPVFSDGTNWLIG